MSAIRFYIGLKLERGLAGLPIRFLKHPAGLAGLHWALIQVISYHGYGKIYPRTETGKGTRGPPNPFPKAPSRTRGPPLGAYPSYVLPWSMAT